MKPSAPLVAAALVAALLLGLFLYLRLWGGVALTLVASAAYAWYRVQVARAQEADHFFGDAGEETRLTAFQGGTHNETPPDPALPADRRPASEPPRPAGSAPPRP